MKSQSLNLKSSISGLVLLCLSITLLFSLIAPLFAEEGSRWSGVDKSVIEKFAKEHGREAREPFINTDQGDLLLFVFLMAGAAGGFMAGYYWRVLLGRRENQ